MNKKTELEEAQAVLEQLESDLSIPFDFKIYTREGKQLPDRYIVFLPSSNSGNSFADGKERLREATVQVSFFYRDKRDELTIPSEIRKRFLSAGFTRGSEGTIPYQPDNGHYGNYYEFNILKEGYNFE